MKASLLTKLDTLSDRYEELTALLGDAEVISDQTKFRAYSREFAEVEPVILAFRDFRKTQADLEGAQALLKDSDPDLREMAEEEVTSAKARLAELEDALQRMLLKGWVKAEWGVTAGNRRARYYRLTPSGRKQLALELSQFERVFGAIQRITQIA